MILLPFRPRQEPQPLARKRSAAEPEASTRNAKVQRASTPPPSSLEDEKPFAQLTPPALRSNPRRGRNNGSAGDDGHQSPLARTRGGDPPSPVPMIEQPSPPPEQASASSEETPSPDRANQDSKSNEDEESKASIDKDSPGDKVESASKKTVSRKTKKSSRSRRTQKRRAADPKSGTKSSAKSSGGKAKRRLTLADMHRRVGQILMFCQKHANEIMSNGPIERRADPGGSSEALGLIQALTDTIHTFQAEFPVC